MKQTKSLLVLFVGILALIAVSCTSTRFMMDPDLSPEPKEALLTGLSIHSSSEGGDGASGLLVTASNLLATLDLDDFGFSAEKALTAYLKTKGFEIFIDAEQAKINDLPINMGESATLLGYWVHPETSAYQPVYFTGFAIGFDKEKHMAGIKGESDVEYYVYADLNISEATTFLIFGGYPIVNFNVAVVDSRGEVVLEAFAFGEGDASFLGINKSEANLSKAFEKAITSLEML